jgi:hypothetical protein
VSTLVFRERKAATLILLTKVKMNEEHPKKDYKTGSRGPHESAADSDIQRYVTLLLLPPPCLELILGTSATLNSESPSTRRERKVSFSAEVPATAR